MELVAYSWLGASAFAPLMAILAAWTTYIFHTYSRKWRMVDLFLLAVVVEELITSLFGFGFAVLSLIRPQLEAPCGFIVWGLTASRTFQIATLTSLLVDRALTVRWPFRYRFSVRRSQIRYHIVVLAVISTFVGVAAVFARSPIVNSDLKVNLVKFSEGVCSIHPLAWDIKFSVFIICLYGVLLFTAVVCLLDVEVRRCRLRSRSPSLSSMFPTIVGQDHRDAMTSSTGTASSGSSSSDSCRPLRGIGRPDWRQHYLDLGWKAVAITSWLCFLGNHFPFLSFTTAGILVPTFWSPWVDNATIWLRLAEGLLVPFILYLTDSPHRGAVKRVFRRRRGKYPTLTNHERFRLPFNDIITGLQKPCSYDPTKAVNFITSYRQPQPKVDTGGPFRSNMTDFNKHMLPSIYSIQPFLEKSSYHLNGLLSGHPAVSISDADSIIKLPSIDTEPPIYPSDTDDDDAHIYATLSGSASSFSMYSDNSRMSLTCTEDNDGGSFTTDANDDFEFHEVRPKRINLLQESDIYRPAFPYSSDSSYLTSLTEKINYLSSKAFYDHKGGDLIGYPAFLQTKSQALSPSRMKEYNENFDKDVLGQTKRDANESLMQVYRINTEDNKKNATDEKQGKTSSVVNKTNLTDEKTPGKDEEEAVYVMPVKSESVISLYKVYLPEERITNGGENALIGSQDEQLSEESCDQDHIPMGSKIADALRKTGRSSIIVRRGNYVKKFRRHQRNRKSKQNQECEVQTTDYRDNTLNNYYGSRGQIESTNVREGTMVSISNLLSALEKSRFSYLDNGDICTHPPWNADMQKVIVSDYI